MRSSAFDRRNEVRHYSSPMSAQRLRTIHPLAPSERIKGMSLVARACGTYSVDHQQLRSGAQANSQGVAVAAIDRRIGGRLGVPETFRVNHAVRLLLCIAWLILPVAQNAAQGLDEKMAELAAKLSQTLASRDIHKVAVTDFVDLQGHPTELGRFLAEQLSVELVNVPEVAVIDRANINRILAEHKLNADGLLDPENAQIVRRFSGVEAILVGTVTSLDEDVVLTVKAVSTETAMIAAAGKINIPRTKETQQFSVHGVSGADARSDPIARASSDVIATEDCGDIRVSLTGIHPVVLGEHASYVDVGYEIALKVTNRNLRDEMLLAINSEDAKSLRRDLNVRARVVDGNGNMHDNADARGISAVRVNSRLSPSTIADVINTGTRRDDFKGVYYRTSKVWYGDLGPIRPNETVNVGITVWREERKSARAEVSNEVRFECEFVIGRLLGNKRTVRTYNVSWGGLHVAAPAVR